MNPSKKEQKKDLKKLSRKQLVKQVLLARDLASHYATDANMAHQIKSFRVFKKTEMFLLVI